MLPLRNIANVRMGATLRGRDAARSDSAGSHRMIQISDIADDGTFRTRDFTPVVLRESLNPDLLLCPGDVLFPNRGSRTTAAVFDEGDPKTFVGAQFFVITPDSRIVHPEYLAWTLRTSEAFAWFDSRRRGTNVLTLQKASVEGFPVPLPPLEIQRTIVEIDRLRIHATELETRIAKLRALYLENRLLQKAKHP